MPCFIMLFKTRLQTESVKIRLKLFDYVDTNQAFQRVLH